LWPGDERQRQRQKQIPFGDDNKKGKDNDNDNGNDNGKRKKRKQKQKQIRGFFASLRMTSKGDSSSSNRRPYWMVRLIVAVWMTEPPVAVTLTA
jgi:hypothetical protein